MPRKKKGKRAIGDLIRGAREDKPRKVPAKDGNGMSSPSVGAATGEAGAARDPEPELDRASPREGRGGAGADWRDAKANGKNT